MYINLIFFLLYGTHLIKLRLVHRNQKTLIYILECLQEITFAEPGFMKVNQFCKKTVILSTSFPIISLCLYMVTNAVRELFLSATTIPFLRALVQSLDYYVCQLIYWTYFTSFSLMFFGWTIILQLIPAISQVFHDRLDGLMAEIHSAKTEFLRSHIIN